MLGILIVEHGHVGRYVHLGHWDRPGQVEDERDGSAFERAQRRLDDEVQALAGIGDGQSVLDVGCGLGGTLSSIEATRRDMRLVGLNVDPRQLAICARLASRAGSSLSWLEGDACALPVADESFDRVLCVEALFHFGSRRRFFAEAARVLRPGGRLVLTDMVLTAAGRRPGAVDARLASDLVAGYGPWPDLRGNDADHVSLGRAAGLVCTAQTDASGNTAPSYRHTTPERVDTAQLAVDPMLRAGLALRALHRDGRLAYLYLRFEKPRAGWTRVGD